MATGRRRASASIRRGDGWASGPARAQPRAARGRLVRSRRGAPELRRAHRRRRAGHARALHGQGLDARRGALPAHRQPRRHQRKRNDDSPDNGGGMKAKVNGIEINYEITGNEGAPWLVLSHSLACSVRMWDPTVEAFKGSFRILNYDMRGHGATTAPKAPYTLDMLADDALGLVSS